MRGRTFTPRRAITGSINTKMSGRLTDRRDATAEPLLVIYGNAWGSIAIPQLLNGRITLNQAIENMRVDITNCWRRPHRIGSRGRRDRCLRQGTGRNVAAFDRMLAADRKPLPFLARMESDRPLPSIGNYRLVTAGGAVAGAADGQGEAALRRAAFCGRCRIRSRGCATSAGRSRALAHAARPWYLIGKRVDLSKERGTRQHVQGWSGPDVDVHVRSCRALPFRWSAPVTGDPC